MKTLLVSLCFAVSVNAAMVRVIDVENGRTLVVERNGSEERVVLAGVAITSELEAREMLRWNVAGKWVMVEQAADGAFLVYRSPDALFVNRELVLRGWARATLPGIEPETHVDVTYLGTINPGRASAGSGSRSGSDTSRRSTTRRSPQASAKSARSSGRGRPAPSTAPSSAARTSDPAPRRSSN